MNLFEFCQIISRSHLSAEPLKSGISAEVKVEISSGNPTYRGKENTWEYMGINMNQYYTCIYLLDYMSNGLELKPTWPRKFWQCIYSCQRNDASVTTPLLVTCKTHRVFKT